MHLDQAGHQMSLELRELPPEPRGAAPTRRRSGEATSAVHETGSSGLDAPLLMERLNRRKRAVTGRWHVDETLYLMGVAGHSHSMRPG